VAEARIIGAGAGATAAIAAAGGDAAGSTGFAGVGPCTGATSACAVIDGAGFGTTIGADGLAAADFQLLDGRLTIDADGDRAAGVSAIGPMPSEASIDAGDVPATTGDTLGEGRTGTAATGAAGEIRATACGATTAFATAGAGLDAATIVGASAVFAGAGSGGGEAWAIAVAATGLAVTGIVAGMTGLVGAKARTGGAMACAVADGAGFGFAGTGWTTVAAAICLVPADGAVV
jgi:hypothetical protein